MTEIPVEKFKALIQRMNVYSRYQEDCFQELCLAWIMGKRTETEWRKVIIDYLFRQRRGIPASHVLDTFGKTDTYDFELAEEEQDIIRFLAPCYRRRIVTKLQAAYIYLWTLGDSDRMIAEHFGVERSSVARNRLKGLQNIRKAVSA